MVQYRKSARGFALRQAPLSGETFGDSLRAYFQGDIIVEQVCEDHEYCRDCEARGHAGQCRFPDLIFLVKREDRLGVRLVGAYRWTGLAGKIDWKLQSRNGRKQ